MTDSPPRDVLAGLGVSLCPNCVRLEGLLLEARLEVADGPRARVLELERNLERANALIGELNDRLCNGRKAS